MNICVTPRDLAKFEECVDWIFAIQNLDASAGGSSNCHLLVQRRLVRRRDLRLIYVGHNQFAVKPLCDRFGRFRSFRSHSRAA